MESNCPFKVLKSPICNYLDIWFEIFKRIPVKALCVLCCVCKSWKTLISSPLFIAHHFFSASRIATTKSYLLLNGRRNTHKPYDLYQPERPIPQRITFLHFPFEIRYRSPHPKNLKIIDFVHGLACLVPPIMFGECAFLWNPSIHKYVDVPCSAIDEKASKYIGFGFGNSKSDFKIVSISYPWGMEKNLQPIYHLFSLQSGQWKQLTANNIDARIISRYNSCYVNGSIHWFATRSWKLKNYIFIYELLVFDCECEVFKTLELPQELAQHPVDPSCLLGPLDFSVELYRFNGMLAVVRFSPHSYVFEIWIMAEYGVVSTWNLLFKNIDLFNCNANFMLEDGGAFFTFVDAASLAPRNPKESTVKRLERRKHYHPINAYAFEESLFLMDQEKPSSRIEGKLVRLLSKGVF